MSAFTLLSDPLMYHCVHSVLRVAFSYARVAFSYARDTRFFDVRVKKTLPELYLFPLFTSENMRQNVWPPLAKTRVHMSY